VHYNENNKGKALINLGKCLTGFFEISETNNYIYLLYNRQTISEKVYC